MSLAAALRVERLAAALEGGATLDADDAAALAAALRAYLSGVAPTLDDALGVRSAPGERTWRTSSALSERDALLRAAVERFLPELPAAEQARRLAEGMRRYVESAWQRERGAELCPQRHVGTIREILWAALRLDPRPLSARRLRAIIAAPAGHELPPVRGQHCASLCAA